VIGSYKVLDAHVHMQPWHHVNAAARAVFERGQPDVARILGFQKDPAAFERYLASEGVEAAVLVNYVAPEVMGFRPDVNDWVAEYARGRPSLVPMGSVNPRVTPDAAAEVARVLALGVRALAYRLQVDQGHRQPRTGVGGATPGVVLGQTTPGIGGDPGVQGAIPAAGEIDGPGHL